MHSLIWKNRIGDLLESFLGFLETIAFISGFGVATIHPNQFFRGIASDFFRGIALEFFTGFTVAGLFSWWPNSLPTKIAFYHKRASLDSKLVIGYWNIHFSVWGRVTSSWGRYSPSWALSFAVGHSSLARAPYYTPGILI
jgi:hypothetical protein